MKYVKIFTFLAFLICFGIFNVETLHATSVPINDAKKAALNWKMHITKNNPNKSGQTINQTIPFTSSTGVNTFYIFTFEEGGFVIVSADDNITPILAYSDENFITEEDIYNYKNEIYFLNKYNSEISYFLSLNSEDLNAKKQWSNVLNNTFEEKSAKSVNAMLTTTWGQGCYYNTLCPPGTLYGYCNHAPAGCSAVAMSQILKYHKFPTHGTGSHSLQTGYGPPWDVLTVDFSKETYNYANMPNSLSGENNDVATLIYDCGVASDESFGPTYTGTSTWNAGNALVTYFNYNYAAANIIYLNQLTQAQWKDSLERNLNQNLPMLYRGKDPSYGGHMFVCDGYNNSDQFHFVFGLGTGLDGWYSVSSITPGSYNLSAEEEAIINLKPNKSNTVEDIQNPDIYKLSNYPNPFKNTTTINYSIPEAGTVKITVYNLLGQVISVINNQKETAGSHSVVFDGSQLKEGIYYYKFEFGNSGVTTQKMIIAR